MMDSQPVIYDRRHLTLELSSESLTEQPAILLFENLPVAFFPMHFINFLNELAQHCLIAKDDENVVVRLFDHNKSKNQCFVQFVNHATACKISAIQPLIYDQKSLKSSQGNLSQTVSDSSQGNLSQTVSDSSSMSEITIDPDIISKAASIHGRTAVGKLGGAWDAQKADKFLRTYLAYSKKRKPQTLFTEVRAHLWVSDRLDFSEEQLKEKLRSLKSYFANMVMKSQAGQDGSSNYAHYDLMLEILPTYKTEQLLAKRMEMNKKSSGKDKWTTDAILNLLDEYKTHQAIFNAVDGTHRTMDTYKLVAAAMQEQGRNFSPEECKKRIESLNSTFFTIQDFSSNQTGAGSCTMDQGVFAALSAIHEGSVASEPPFVFNAGAQSIVKRGSVAPVKVVGAAVQPVKLRRPWNWQTDAPVCTGQRKTQLENQKAEVTMRLQEQLLANLESINKARMERDKK